MRAFPSGDVEHKVSLDGGMAPRWRGDARELLFLSLDVTMMAARVDTAHDFHGTNPESPFATGLSLITLRPYAVARDGQRFLVPTAADPRAHSPITIVINWPAASRTDTPRADAARLGTAASPLARSQSQIRFKSVGSYYGVSSYLLWLGVRDGIRNWLRLGLEARERE